MFYITRMYIYGIVIIILSCVLMMMTTIPERVYKPPVAVSERAYVKMISAAHDNNNIKNKIEKFIINDGIISHDEYIEFLKLQYGNEINEKN